MEEVAICATDSTRGPWTDARANGVSSFHMQPTSWLDLLTVGISRLMNIRPKVAQQTF